MLENEILRAELERLFELDELLTFSRDLLGFAPDEVGDTFAKASFARALAAHCAEHDAIEALCDALVATRTGVSSAVENIRAFGLTHDELLAPGTAFGPFQDLQKLSEGPVAIAYTGRIHADEFRVSILRREVARDRRGVHRLGTLTRLLAAMDHPGLPRALSAGVANDRAYVAHAPVSGSPLSRIIERGPDRRFGELRALLREILVTLAALHERRLVHGNLRPETVIVEDATDHPVLLDAGFDRLWSRRRMTNGSAEGESPALIAPEQARGLDSDPRSDVYSFGVLLALLTGAQPSQLLGISNRAVVAPRAAISAELDELVLRLLAKDPNARPANAAAVLALFDKLAITGRREAPELTAETLNALNEQLAKEPNDPDALLALEEAGTGSELAERAGDRLLEAARGEGADKALLLRAGRVFASRTETRERGERAYLEYLEFAPDDHAARAALLEIRRRLGKFDEVLEMLLEDGERAPSQVEKARIFSEIGRVYANDVRDPEQALVAFTQAFLDDPRDSAHAAEVERLAGSRVEAWNDVLQTATAAAQEDSRDSDARALMLNRIGHWSSERAQRPDLAASAFQAVLAFDPGNEPALDGLASVYRRAQQWPELAALLSQRADTAPTPAKARELRTDAAEIYETQLNDPSSARSLYERVLDDDPVHPRASTKLARIYERSQEPMALVALLDKTLSARRGDERTATLCRIAEVFETELDDPAEAIRRFSAALDHDPTSVEALRGLDRLYTRLGRFQELLDNLERQIELSATPRQRVTLLERASRIQAEEFLDYEKAAGYAERVLAIDPSHQGALAAAIRHARGIDRWEDVARLSERQIAGLDDPGAKVHALLELGRVLADRIGAPDRAARAFEAVLEFDAEQPQALEALAKLRESAGDTERALSAIEALAQKATTAEGRAEQWVRAARLLESRSDIDGAIERYKRALENTPKDSAAATAAILGRMSRLYREALADRTRAEDAAKRSLALDPTNTDALIVLADAAFDEARYLEAGKHFEALADRGESLDPARFRGVLIRYADTLSRAGTPEKALKPLERLLKIAPDDREAVQHAAEVVFAHGDAGRAAEIYAQLDALSADAADAERAEILYRRGEALRRAGRLAEALTALEESAELGPTVVAPLVALAKIHEAEGRFGDAVKVKLRHLDLAAGDERVQLLLDVSELAGSKLGDRAQATKMLVAALDERPDDRRLLTRLMQLYSEEKDWGKLVEVVLRLADFVDDPKQRIKYLHTAAIVTSRQIGDTGRALEFYDQVLALEPSFDKAIAESIELRRSIGDHTGVEALLKRKLALATTDDDRAAMTTAFDELADLYEKNLGWMDQAIDASEAAHTLDPTNTARSVRLRRLYATDAGRYLDKATASELELLRENPYNADSYRALRRMYTEAKRADEAWCLCQALSVLKLAEPDEERFYKRMRPETAAPAERPLDDETWLLDLMHPDADALLTSVFALIEPAVIARRSSSILELGYDTSWLVNPAEHPAPVCQSLYYAAGVLGLPLPPCYENPNDPGGVSFLFAHEPSLVLGVTSLRTDVPLRVAAFIAAQKLASLRPGMYVRQLLASGTALKAWLFGAIKLTSPTFPVAPELEGAVTEALAALGALVQGQARDHLTRVVAKLLTSGAALDLKRWVAAIDLTADRAGFLLSHDLETALSVIRASDDPTNLVAIDDRVRELLLYSISPEYLSLRKKLKITVDS